MIIDTHCHLDLYPNPNSMIKELERKSIITIGMTNLPSHFKQGYPHTRNLKKVRLALGMHPLMASSHNKEFPLFIKYLNLTSYIGEIGLDFSKEGIASKKTQINSFERILDLVKGKNKILSIHSRKAEKDVLDLLRSYNIDNAIFHWYSGSLNLIDKITESGYYFSVNTAMIKSKNGQNIIKKIPKERILTETDGPFIKHKSKIVTPVDIKDIITYLNKSHNLENSEIQINRNFRKLIDRIK